ncbi:unnamed protein product [Schistosoma turkestanicum]|nr:unnamed protein product [Schistosoma turkestanicum]
MYTNDEYWMRTYEDASVHLRPSPPHYDLNNLWISDSTLKHYSPTPFNISSAYSSSSSPAADPSFLTDSMTTTPAILDNQYNPYFNNTGNLLVPYKYTWDDKEDDYHMYTLKSCYCESQQNDQLSNNETDFSNHYQTREVNGLQFHKICSCTANYPSICEIHSLDINGDKSRKITTDYSIQSTKICDYPESVVTERSYQNSNGLTEGATNSSWFDLPSFLSFNSKSSNIYHESFSKWSSDNFTTTDSEIFSKACTENYTTDSEIQTFSNSFEPLSSVNGHSEVKIYGKKLSKPYPTDFSNGNLVDKSWTEKSSIPFTNINNNENSSSGALMAAASAALANLHRRGSLQLWQFLIALLDDKDSQHLICWTGRTLEFKLNDPEEIKLKKNNKIHDFKSTTLNTDLKSCYCEAQQNEQLSNNETDFSNHYQTREVNGLQFHKICSCTANYPSICEIHSLDINGDKSRKITTDYSIQSTKICDYPEAVVTERSYQNSNALTEGATNSSWFDLPSFLSFNSKSSNIYHESFSKWSSDNFTTTDNEIFSKACTENYTTDSEIQTFSNSFEPLSSVNGHSEVKIYGKKLSKPYPTNFSNGNLVDKSWTEKSSIPFTNINNNENSSSGALMAAASAALANLHRRGSLQLWQFLIALLDDKDSQHLICWTGRTLEFKLNDPEEVARLWGIQKNRPAMNYDKLSRSLRYYYEKGIMQKVSGERYVYRFVYEPELLFSLAFPGEEHSNQQLISSKMTAKTIKENKLCNYVKQLPDSSLNTPDKLNRPNTHYSFASNHFNHQPTDNKIDCMPTDEERFGVKRRYKDILEEERITEYDEKIHEIHSVAVATNDSDNHQFQLPDKYENNSSILVHDKEMYSEQSINNNNIITSNQFYNDSNNNFLTINPNDSQNNLTDKLNDNSNWLRTDDPLQKTESSTSHIDWFDNLTIQKEQQQQQPLPHCTISENHHLMNYSTSFSNYHQYDNEHSLLLSPNIYNKIDIWSDRQDYYLSEMSNFSYDKEQEKLSSSSSPSSSSSSSSPALPSQPSLPSSSSSSSTSSTSFILSLNDRHSLLSTPPPITVNLQNIYEINYELLTSKDQFTYHPFFKN